ncbi:hypothetical protein [Deinococcus radiodurans]|jgi:hypothetical protein|uniref:Uncharacterized protein n=1 Tax=Deinococcus radiodurans (strain ATCC 13939 / DSM 20539 / JCM 16871 / CCUG 27074 / LMG 4051 / NBRC 15346 / NCIMB 9279 / VKM B-1422 / R1) TaxID=243230 RepID=Q9RZ54_DEIRA|nr:hypothetical protein [Deinococcus radiodurans]AAF12334.1 hypothetical protein DR_A0100 [Deinococcus radiodurans R1 = ATCC 13939 = DSM 20539]ANC72959.1 hypothetical protein A2G07_13985 [Deinococcus radiodurans R1 = ATCC 13939 = DSM 20539]QEM72917.1 hypothetical protein DXG80_13965 [Deinococcus radiodurans]QIP30402.1 hypothetical protein HAV23_14210 [Deinococcus radiodurans]QIP33240.1 hypothetical protein HAV35_13785 [Deinococcus radiodurans]
MSDEKQDSAWFRHRDSGQVFEASGRFLPDARKNRELEETINPETAVKMELDKREIKYQPNTGYKKLQALLTEALEAEAAQKPD